jgi:molybdate transport system substrate-binding protein
MRVRILPLGLLIVLLGNAACASPGISVASVPTTAPAASTIPPQPPVETKTLTVLAAASLTESFAELGELFESRNLAVTVSFSFANAQQLARQISEGAEADVFASASKKYMDAAVESGRVNGAEARVFARNRLVVVFPKDNPANLVELKGLATPGIKLVLADKSAPIGQYSLDFLDKAAADPAFGAQFKDNVLGNVVSYEENVKTVFAKVSLGEADAGIVYVTDITVDAAATVGRLNIPDALNTIAAYPIAPLSDSKNAGLARAFVALVLSPEGQQILAKYGFAPAAEESGSNTGFTVMGVLEREVKLPAAQQPRAGEKIVAVSGFRVYYSQRGSYGARTPRTTLAGHYPPVEAGRAGPGAGRVGGLGRRGAGSVLVPDSARDFRQFSSHLAGAHRRD